jgi:hypothetical protein
MGLMTGTLPAQPTRIMGSPDDLEVAAKNFRHQVNVFIL